MEKIVNYYTFAEDDYMFLKANMEEDLQDFQIEKRKVILADGYYFSAIYPGNEAFFANEEDVQICWEAVQETKKAVDRYLIEHLKGNNLILN